MNRNFRKSNMNNSFSGFRQATATPKKSICRHHPYQSPGGDTSTSAPPTLTRCKPSLDLRQISQEDIIAAEVVYETPTVLSQDGVDRSLESPPNSQRSMNERLLALAESSGIVSDLVVSGLDHSDTSQNHNQSSFDTVEQQRDSGFYPFSADSAALQSFNAMNSTTVEQDEMWPEYSEPVRLVPRLGEQDYQQMVQSAGFTKEEIDDIMSQAQAGFQKYKANHVTQQPSMHSNVSHRPTTAHEMDHVQQMMQRQLRIQKNMDVVPKRNCFKRKKEHHNAGETIVIEKQSGPNKVFYIYVDQVDHAQQELLIRASPYMRDFFFELSMEPDECSFRRVLFTGITREQFLLLIRYLNHGRAVLEQLTLEELICYKHVALKYWFKDLERHCDEVSVETYARQVRKIIGESQAEQIRKSLTPDHANGSTVNFTKHSLCSI